MPSASTPPALPPDANRGWNTFYARPLPWLLALAAAHVAVRLAISPSLKWDEAQQILWTQQLALGYGAQPPLYTWLQWGFNQAFGPGVLALALLKHALIALTCVFLWLAARQLLGRRAAWWAASSLFLMPPFGWDAINDRPHTVLVTAMTCAAWWLLLRIVRRAGRDCWREFAALGLACGGGMLAKYNFALMLAALLAALLSVRQARRALLGPGWWLAPLTGLAAFAPHGWWLLSHWDEATAATLEKMHVAPRLGAGLLDLFTTAAGVLLPWALVALAAFDNGWWRRPDTAPESPAWLRPVFGRYLALLAAALLAMVLAAHVTVFRNHWMLPLLAPAPLMALALRPELDASARGKRMTALTLALIITLLAAVATRPWVAYIDGKVQPANYPAAQLAQALQNAGYDGRGRIIAADNQLAGTLRTRFPGARAADCSQRASRAVASCVAHNVQLAANAGQGWLVISHTGQTEPDWWSQALERIPDSGALPRGKLHLPFRMVRPGHAPDSYDFIWQPAP